jgi:hypothetical protein
MYAVDARKKRARRLLEVRGGEILNTSGHPIASVDGGDDAQCGLLGAALIVFCSSWPPLK